MINVAIIGSGGREHALAQKIHESKNVNLFVIPGNPGTEKIAKNITLENYSNESILKFCLDENIELVVIGPEQPLVDGLADLLRDNKIAAFGPNKEAAMIEGNKTFSKNLMKKYNIPTAAFETFNVNNKEKCITYLSKVTYPIVIKASGLAAGKGVLICNSFDEAKETIYDMFDNSLFGESGHSIVVEEFMEGLEASIFAITDGDEYVILPTSQDHKRIFDNDKGKNTGGMGAYAPAPLITDELLQKIENQIIVPTLEAMRLEGKKYNGCLYAGIMVTEKGPKVVEFNCRFGDPETQVVLPIIEGDFLQLLNSAAMGKIDRNSIQNGSSCAVCVVASSGGYPDSYEIGFEINGLDQIVDKNTFVFHAGTKYSEGKIVTNGGRVLGVTRLEKSGDLNHCKKNVYDEINKIKFTCMHYRNDISDKMNSTIN